MAAVTRSATPLRNALVSVLATARASRSIACTCCGAVARELDGLQAAAAADVEAALAGSDLLAEQVAPDEEAALRRHEHARLEDQVGEREREQVAPGAVGPALDGLRARRRRDGRPAASSAAAAGPARCARARAARRRCARGRRRSSRPRSARPRRATAAPSRRTPRRRRRGRSASRRPTGSRGWGRRRAACR